jgi:hypothetical protein
MGWGADRQKRKETKARDYEGLEEFRQTPADEQKWGGEPEPL